MRRRHLAALLLVLSAGFLYAQTTAEPTEPGTGQTEPPAQGTAGAAPAETQEPTEAAGEVKRAPVPLPLNMDASSLQFSSEQAHVNYLNAGVNVGASYDDNLLNLATPTGGFTFSVLPNIGIDIARRRLALKMDYAGGYTINERYSAYNQSSHDGEVDLRYRLTPHVNLRVDDRFVYSTGFFNQLPTGSGAGGSGVIQQSNVGVLTPLAPHTDDLGTVDLTYQYSATDMVGASTTFHSSSFGAPPAGSTSLVNTQSEQADAFYAHGFNPRNWSGVTYSFERMTFNPVFQQVDTHSFLLFHTIYLQPQMQLALFAGPYYTQISGEIISTTVTLPLVRVTSVPTLTDRWSVAGGASFNWKGQHTSVRASGVHKIDDGGGLLTAVAVTSGNGAWRRQLTRNATIELGALYSDSRALQASSTTYSLLKTASGSVVWDQQMGRNLTASLGYARDYQNEKGVAVNTVSLNHNRAWITVGYHFTRPLGR
jgi:hypothetical protein